LPAKRLDNGKTRRGGRVVECAGLENRYGLTPIGGSNPPLSAMFPFYFIIFCTV